MTRPSLRQKFLDSPPSSILVIRTGGLGSLLLSTPFLEALREAFPLASITLWVSPGREKVLSGTKLADQIVTSLPSGYFELAISLNSDKESLKNTLASSAPVRVGFTHKKGPFSSLLARRCLTHLETLPSDTGSEHEIEWLDRLARKIGLPRAADRPISLGRSYRKEDWIVLHFCKHWLSDGWSGENLMRLLYGLESLGRLVVTAGPKEADFLDAADFADFDLRTGLTFEEWCRLIGEAKVFVSADSGVVQLAAAVGTPVVVAVGESERSEHPWMVDYRRVSKKSDDNGVADLLTAVESLGLFP